MPFTCACCGVELPDVPTSWALRAPDYWSADASGESFLDEELCVIDVPEAGERHFFIRGTIDIPVRAGGADGPDTLTYTVWVSLSPANFARAVAHWDDPARVREPAYFGWLSNSLPGYPETLRLRTMVHTQEPGRRPRVEVEPTDHPLAVEQREGVAAHRLAEIAELARG